MVKSRQKKRRVTAPPTRAALAQRTLDGIPPIMRFIRTEMRGAVKGELTVPQFRALVQLSAHGPMTNGQLAERQGVSVAAMSRMVDTLVDKGLVRRHQAADDRREWRIAPTPLGNARYEEARRAVRGTLVERFAGMSEDERATVSAALAILSTLF